LVHHSDLRMPTGRWRLVITQPAPGAWNMAVDEAILEACGRSEVLPTLRLFAWDPACLSLGYAQPSDDVDTAELARQGWLLVRRPTGGRAILHTDELTYSVIGPAYEPRLAGSVLESYQRLSRALLAALHMLGVPAVATPTPDALEKAGSAGPVCFEVPSNYEITVGGKKLIGSAQARRIEGILQHGSLPLCGDLGRITQVLNYPDTNRKTEARNRLLARAATLEEILGHALPWEAVAQAFTEGFKRALNLDFIPSDLTPAERSRTDELVVEKYANPVWTGRV